MNRRTIHHCDSRVAGIPQRTRRTRSLEPSAAELRDEIEILEAVIESRALEAALKGSPPPCGEVTMVDPTRDDMDHETSLLLQRVPASLRPTPGTSPSRGLS